MDGFPLSTWLLCVCLGHLGHLSASKRLCGTRTLFICHDTTYYLLDFGGLLLLIISPYILFCNLLLSSFPHDRTSPHFPRPSLRSFQSVCLIQFLCLLVFQSSETSVI